MTKNHEYLKLQKNHASCMYNRIFVPPCRKPVLLEVVAYEEISFVNILQLWCLTDKLFNTMKHRMCLFALALLGVSLAMPACSDKEEFDDSSSSVDVPDVDDDEGSSTEDLLAFPGAEGFGRYTTGGRGGVVYHVTKLVDDGSLGTLRYAISQKGPRTIVFDVAGTINLQSPLKISNGDLTIAGQSAPGDGICIAKAGVTLAASNIIIRYLRFRPGNEYRNPSTGDIDETDGLGGTDRENIIIDHCSVSWSVDECLSVYGSENFTVQWCIASEALHEAGHSKGAHGYGGNWGGARASYHHNLIAHCSSRVPRLGPRVGTQTHEHMDMRNNVFYNWSGNGCYGGEGMKINIVNNYYKPGPATELANDAVKYRIAQIGVRTKAYCHDKNGNPNDWFPMQHVWGKYYIDGNVMEGNAEVSANNWEKGVLAQTENGQNVDYTYTTVTQDTIKLHEPLDAGFVTTHSAKQAYQLVMKYVGCSIKRDKVDERIIAETVSGTATYGTYQEKDSNGKVKRDYTGRGFINTPQDVMETGETTPWPTLKASAEELSVKNDTDGDGIPDAWEIEHGLDPNNKEDGKRVTLNKTGYTNLEVYLNELVKDITESQNRF